jgi:hypothetical protein
MLHFARQTPQARAQIMSGQQDLGLPQALGHLPQFSALL